MIKRIYKTIKNYDKIVIARHIGVDPDAMASQIALRDSIVSTFPEKMVYALGNGSVKFNFLGRLDKAPDDLKDALLIVLDTPDLKRIDLPSVEGYKEIIKIDHHPFVDKFSELEYIDTKSSSTCEIIMKILEETKLECNRNIAEKLFLGLVSDSNRFLFSNTTGNTFEIVGRYMNRYNLKITDLYSNLYMRSIAEVKFQGFCQQIMKVTDNGLGSIVINEADLEKFNVDTASTGNMINNFNYIDEVIVWVSITEDKKNDIIRINIRSRGPEINRVAERYNGGGHKLAAGCRVKTMAEANDLLDDLDEVCKKYIDNLEGVNDEN